MNTLWMVRAGRDSVYVEEFLQEGLVAIGWQLGPTEKGVSKSALETLYRQSYPRDSDGRVRNNVGQIYRFIQEIKEGDRVTTYDREKRIYYLGTVTSEAIWDPSIVEDLPRIRRVSWEEKVSRDNLSAQARNTLGAIQTLFQVNKTVATEMKKQSVPIEAETSVPVPETNDEEALLEEQIRLELVEKAEEAIEDRIVYLDWEEMQELVAGILRAMGYRTAVAKRGPDRGFDVFASPDGLGLEEPRVFVEVKHRPNQTIGSQDIRSFLGGRSPGDRCLYVSTGGYTKDARYEAERSIIPIQLLGLVDLRRLLVQYYESLDESTRAMIPLKRIYVLAD